VQLHVETSGNGEPLLVLLHGQGANGAVFEPLVQALAWPGRVVIPDLRGHGRSPHATHYGMAHHAADVADLFEPNTLVHVVGHSMGGAVALVLASGLFGVRVARVSAFGIKVNWTVDELAKAEGFATTPARWFASRAEAADRFIRVSGLAGYATPSDRVVDAGIVEQSGKWRLAADNATVRAAIGPVAADMVATARCPVRLFCGARDPMVTAGELAPLDAKAFAVEDCGHNPHIEAPAKVAAIVRKLHGIS
jgi:pimeloyl-ACP methyl ester carboxylesterase